ncbi:hypothetical protein E2562_030787 [Oryza meyeriana var. granulata]|nr:hypothetical protein E2562_030787 [Oryza meyeriana var. granulata]KAF0896941.1 hypothetical protein E2562_030787 [Oryza meyeriana var. granulata]
MLKFYKREISPLLPSSCRYVPTCSEYSMQAYKRYGVAKGTILTAWRLCRCNPLDIGLHIHKDVLHFIFDHATRESKDAQEFYCTCQFQGKLIC